MPSTDPFQRLMNPYSRGEALDVSSRPTRIAGRALAIGALGLGASAVLTGTGFAAEDDPPAEGASEVVSGTTSEEQVSIEPDSEELVESGSEESGSVDPETDQSEFVDPESTQPETVEPGPDDSDSQNPDTTQPEPTEPETIQPETVEPGPDNTDSQNPDTNQPEFVEPGSGQSEVVASEFEQQESTDFTGTSESEANGQLFALDGVSDEPDEPDEAPDRSGDSGSGGFELGPAIEELSGGGDLVEVATGDVDGFTAGSISISDVDLGSLDGGWEEVAFRNSAGDSFRLGDVVEQFRGTDSSSPGLSIEVPQSVLESIRLPQSVRDSIVAQNVQRDSVAAGSVGATSGEPDAIRVAPGISYTPPRFASGTAQLDVDEGRVGVTGLGSGLGTISFEGSRTARVGDGVSVRGASTTNVRLNEQGNQPIYLPGDAESTPRPDRVDVLSSNTGTLFTGVLPPDKQPTGNQSARWGAVGASVGADSNVALANGDGSVITSGTVRTPVSVFARAGDNNPDTRWTADVTGTITPQYSFGQNGSDTQTTTSASATFGGEIGDRRNGDGNFLGDTDLDGRGAGSVVSGGVFGQYADVEGGQITVPRTTRQIDADSTQYRVGVRGGVELREDQPRFEAGVELNGTAGYQGSSIQTEFGSASTGPTFFANGQAAADAEFRTAPRGDTGAYIRADGTAAVGVLGDQTTYSAQVTPRVGGDIRVGEGSTVGANLGYRVGITNETTLRDGSTTGGPYNGLVAGVGGEFPVFGGRGSAGIEYSAANPDGGDSVAVRVGYTPGETRQSPQRRDSPLTIPNATDVAQFDTDGPADVGISDTSVVTPLLVAGPGAPSVANPTTQNTPGGSEPGSQASGASALEGTTPVGIDLVSPALVDGTVPGGTVVGDTVSGDTVQPTVPVFDGSGALSIDPSVTVGVVDEALNIPLEVPLVTLPETTVAPPVVEVAAPVVEVAPPPVVVAPPVVAPLPLPPVDVSPVFATGNLGLDTSVTIPTNTSFTAPDLSFLDSGSFGFSGGGFSF